MVCTSKVIRRYCDELDVIVEIGGEPIDMMDFRVWLCDYPWVSPKSVRGNYPVRSKHDRTAWRPINWFDRPHDWYPLVIWPRHELWAMDVDNCPPGSISWEWVVSMKGQQCIEVSQSKTGFHIYTLCPNNTRPSVPSYVELKYETGFCTCTGWFLESSRILQPWGSSGGLVCGALSIKDTWNAKVTNYWVVKLRQFLEQGVSRYKALQYILWEAAQNYTVSIEDVNILCDSVRYRQHKNYPNLIQWVQNYL